MDESLVADVVGVEGKGTRIWDDETRTFKPVRSITTLANDEPALVLEIFAAGQLRPAGLVILGPAEVLALYKKFSEFVALLTEPGGAGPCPNCGMDDTFGTSVWLSHEDGGMVKLVKCPSCGSIKAWEDVKPR
jgi:predicted RNA-binding Zn-ribbon protein involved in translation (DUF1610 family)